MSRVLIILNNHTAYEQISELKKQFHIKELLFFLEDMKNYLINIPLEVSVISKDFLKKLTEPKLRNLQKNDFICIQTEYGVIFYIIGFALTGFSSIYSITKRVYEEKIIDAESIEFKQFFRYVIFRKYIKLG